MWQEAPGRVPLVAFDLQPSGSASITGRVGRQVTLPSLRSRPHAARLGFKDSFAELMEAGRLQPLLEEPD